MSTSWKFLFGLVRVTRGCVMLFFFFCSQCADQLSALLHSFMQTVLLEKKALNVPEPARTWIYPVSVWPASLAACVPLAQYVMCYSFEPGCCS